MLGFDPLSDVLGFDPLSELVLDEDEEPELSFELLPSLLLAVELELELLDLELL